MSRPYSNYQDPYQEGGAEYLNDRPDYQTPGGSSAATATDAPGYGHYNQYSRSSMEKQVDPDGVNALGEIGGGERRQQPGRAHLGGVGAPMSSFEAFGPPPRSTGILRMWRKDERGKQWTRGGGFRTGARMVCCCLTIAILLVISIILSILLYIRPPSVIINTNNWQSQSGIKIDNGQMSGIIPVDVSVVNPNWFDADFKQIKAEVKADGYDLTLGQGVSNNAKFARNSLSEFTFNVNVNFTFTGNDAQVQGVLQLLKKNCVSTSSNLPIKIKIGLWLRLLGQTLKIPDISIRPSIPCPEGIDQLTARDLRHTIEAAREL